MARIIPTGPDTFQYVEDDAPAAQYQQPASVQQQAQQRASNYRIPAGSYVQRMTGPDTFDVLEYGDNPGAQVVWVGEDYGGAAQAAQQPSAQEWKPAARAPSPSQYLGINWRPSQPGGEQQSVPYTTVSPPGVSGAVPGQYQTPVPTETVIRRQSPGSNVGLIGPQTVTGSLGVPYQRPDQYGGPQVTGPGVIRRPVPGQMQTENTYQWQAQRQDPRYSIYGTQIPGRVEPDVVGAGVVRKKPEQYGEPEATGPGVVIPMWVPDYAAPEDIYGPELPQRQPQQPQMVYNPETDSYEIQYPGLNAWR